MTLKSFKNTSAGTATFPFEFHAVLEGNMAKHKKSVSGDNALREFYEACGLGPATIEGAIKARYEPSTTMANRDRAVAEVMARRLRERQPAKMRNAK
jgi:hypothetical protein